MKNWKLPLAVDSTGSPSATLLFAYVSFILAIAVTIYLFQKDAIAGGLSALMLFFGCLLMYRLRRLDNFSIDLDDREIKVNSAQKEDSDA